jgi:hypothetical protein
MSKVYWLYVALWNAVMGVEFILYVFSWKINHIPVLNGSFTMFLVENILSYLCVTSYTDMYDYICQCIILNDESA